MRLMDILLVLPCLLLAIVIVAILGPGLFNAMLAVAIVLLPQLHAPDARRGAVRTGARLRHRRRACAGAGTLRLMFDDRAAELHGAADRAGDARLLHRHPRRRGARLPRPRRAAADAGMGHHAGRRAANTIQRAWWVVTLPGPVHPDHRARVQPVRRRAARRARSEAEALMAWRCSKSATWPSNSPPRAGRSARWTACRSDASSRARCSASSASPAPARASPCWR